MPTERENNYKAVVRGQKGIRIAVPWTVLREKNPQEAVKLNNAATQIFQQISGRQSVSSASY